MNPLFKPETRHPSVLMRRLDQIRMPESDRTIAKSHLHQAEQAVDILFEAMRVLRTTAAAWRTRLFPGVDRERDAYLSGAVDRIDLERRIRTWERRPSAFRDGA